LIRHIIQMDIISAGFGGNWSERKKFNETSRRRVGSHGMWYLEIHASIARSRCSKLGSSHVVLFILKILLLIL